MLALCGLRLALLQKPVVVVREEHHTSVPESTTPLLIGTLERHSNRRIAVPDRTPKVNHSAATKHHRTSARRAHSRLAQRDYTPRSRTEHT